jgi:hypothetical protein
MNGDKLPDQIPTRETRGTPADLNEQLFDALTILYQETAEYIYINNLGDIHHNRSMQVARDALNAAAAECVVPKETIIDRLKQRLDVVQGACYDENCSGCVKVLEVAAEMIFEHVQVLTAAPAGTQPEK